MATYTNCKCTNTNFFRQIYTKIRTSIIYISIPFDSQRITYRLPRLFLTKNRYCSRGGSRLITLNRQQNAYSASHHFFFAPRTIETNYVLFPANFRGIFYFQPLSNNPATLFTWLDNCALSTPGVYPRHAISNRPSECKWREMKCGVIDHPASEWRIFFATNWHCY